MNGADWPMWVAALITYPLLTADTKSASWAFLLGADLALGLYCLLRIVMSA